MSVVAATAPLVASRKMYETQLLAEAGVLVTTARFVVGHQTYPMGTVTTVAPFTIKASSFGTYVLGALFGLFALGSVFATVGAASAEKDVAEHVLFSGFWVLLWSVLSALLFWSARSKKDTHGVIIATSGMQVRALVTTDLDQVHRVVNALNHAIATR